MQGQCHKDEDLFLFNKVNGVNNGLVFIYLTYRVS